MRPEGKYTSTAFTQMASWKAKSAARACECGFLREGVGEVESFKWLESVLAAKEDRDHDEQKV